MNLYRCDESMVEHSPTMKAVFDQLNGFGALVPVEIDYEAAVREWRRVYAQPDSEQIKAVERAIVQRIVDAALKTGSGYEA